MREELSLEVPRPAVVRLRPAVGQSGLDEDPGHEAESAGGAGFFSLDFERFLRELLGLGAAPKGGRESRPFSITGGVPNGPLQNLPEAMRTVVSTRRAGPPTRLRSCPSVS